MKYDTILLDADDTLLDFKRAEKEALKMTLERFALSTEQEVFSTYSKINDGYWKALERGDVTKKELRVRRFADLCECFGFDASPSDMADEYEKNLSLGAYIIDGAYELCKDLAARYKVYIVTNGQKKVQKGRLFGSVLKDLFIKAFISEDVGYEKPRIEYFEAVASEIPAFDKSKTVIIGDSLTSDIKGGINFGIDTCWYNPKSKERPEGMNITYTVSSFDDIRKIFLK